MEWYRYNPDTFEYENPVTCQPNPARPGEFLIPPSATPQTPPTPLENEVAVFDQTNDRWEIKPDYRGTEYWLPDGSHHKIEAIGDTPPDNALYEQPPDLTAIYQANGYARQERITRDTKTKQQKEQKIINQYVRSQM